MASEFEAKDFLDTSFQTSATTPPSGSSGRARYVTREELEAKTSETQQRLADLKRQQELLERERASLDDARRRRGELQNGREELLTQLTRGVGLLEEAHLRSRQETEQMGRTLEAFKEALGKIEAIREETWTDENWNLELTRALTTLDNARMEWNSARLKFKVLDGPVGGGGVDGAVAGGLGASNFAGLNRQQLMTFGLAIALPVAVALFLGLVVLGLMLRHR